MLLVLLIFLLFRILFVPFRYYKVVGFEVVSQSCFLMQMGKSETVSLLLAHHQNLDNFLSRYCMGNLFSNFDDYA